MGNGAEVKIDGSVSHAQRNAGDLHRALGMRDDPEQPTVGSPHPGAERHSHFRGFHTEQNSEQR
jgi:hypothetical protein